MDHDTSAECDLLSRSGLPRAAAVHTGPAGERQVRTACIVTEDEKARTFGRVMAAVTSWAQKNLKGIVLRGTSVVAPAHRAGLQRVKQMVRSLNENGRNLFNSVEIKQKFLYDPGTMALLGG